MKKLSLMSAAAAVAMLGAVSGGFSPAAVEQSMRSASNTASPTKGQANKTASAKKQAAAVRSGRSGTYGNKYPAPGWSVAQDRRNARKRRNVLRHRASRKG